MKLSKKEEAAVLKAYKAYFDSYTTGDVKTIASLLTEDYTQIGSAEAEVFYDKKEAIHFLNDTIDQVAGKAEMRNRVIKAEKLDGYVLIIDLFDMYVLVEDEWSFYAKLRASTLMEKTKSGWKFVYQHSSMPDTRANEGDNIAIEKISAENQQLREAVKRRTVELESKNRELEIEAALERVRAKAMAMQTSNELSALVHTVFEELKKLDFALNWCMINIIDESSMSNMLWAASPQTGKAPECYHMKSEVNRWRFHKEFMQAWKERKTNWDFVLKGDEKKAYYEYLFSETEVGSLPDNVQTEMLAAKEHFYSYTFSTFGGLQTVGDEPLSDANLDILSRFGKVFDLTYTRFNDLKQAEEQAREAQIEVALERVRGRTMAMQKSDEMPEVANNLFLQVQELGLPAWSAGYCIWQDDKKAASCSMSSEGLIQKSFTLPSIGVGYNFYDPAISGENFYVAKLGGKEIIAHYKFMRTLPVVGEILDGIIAAGFDLPSFQIFHIVYFNHGYLMFITYEPVPDSHDLFKRFASVFEQTYTRFLDLQKAEEQAREVEIELALERVRARTMAMQKSDELKEVVAVQYEQMGLLDMADWASNIIIMDEPKKSYELWLSIAEQNILPESYTLDIKGHKLLKEQWKIWQNQLEGRHIHLEGQAKKEYDKYVLNDTDLIRLPVKVKKAIKSISEMYVSMASMKCGLIASFNFNAPLSKSEFQILQRFAKVFDQTYTRFLDLQKAEAQAREAKIEAALERVRAATMAMHKSADLHKVVLLVLAQMEALDVNMSSALIHEFREPLKDQYFWIAAGGITYPDVIHLPYIQNQFFTRFEKARNKSESFFSDEFSKTEKNKLWKYSFTYSPVPKKRQQFVLSSPGLCRSTALFENTAITILRYDKTPFIEEENSILIRFGQVFQQTYTRFLDLQKAEEQAREAQIEASLERVRARSMGMHGSKELIEVVRLLDGEIRELGIKVNGGTQITTDFRNPKKGMNLWLAVKGMDFLEKFHCPYTDHPVHHKLLQALKNGTDFFTEKYSQAEKNRFLRFLYKHSDFKRIPKKRQGITLDAKEWARSSVIGNNSTIAFQRYGKEFSDEENAILKRFGNVFEQTYTRFLDLQKAEAQAREAQIETALERVRAITMAMHKSKDLSTAITTVFSQLSVLNFTTIRCGIGIFNDRTRRVDAWTASEGEENNTAKLSGDEILEGHPLLEGIFDAWENQQEYSYVLEGDDLKEYYNVTANSNLPVSGPKGNVDNVTQYYHCVMFPAGGLFAFKDKPFTDEEKILMRRFADVFHLTFIRHLDLMQAEAQAREAQIEVALERVRASSMAMHHSHELPDMALTVLNQLDFLGIQDMLCSINIVNPDTKNFVSYSAVGIEASNKKVRDQLPEMSMNDVGFLKTVADRLEKGESFFTLELKNADLKEMLELWKASNFSGLKNKNIAKKPEVIYLDCFQINELSTISVSSTQRLTEEQVSILQRMTSTFSLSYTRFLDLQKAEEQAREAQIEAALERVRSQTMAMHNSQDVDAAVLTLFEEILKLNVDESIRCGIAILSNTDNIELWSASFDVNNKLNLFTGNINPNVHPLLMGAKKAWEEKQQRYDYKLSGKDLVSYYKILNDAKDYSFQIDLTSLPREVFNNSFIFPEGILFAFTAQPKPEESLQVLSRFTGVFEQTYTRFLDLQKAEEQVREAQIEAALERVRSRTLAMHKSSELSEAGGIIFEQLSQLGIEAETSFISLIDTDNDLLEIWTAHGSVLADPVKVKASDHPNHKAEIETWKTGQEIIEIPMPKKDFIILVKAKFNIDIADRKDQSLFFLTQVRHQFGFIGMGTWKKLTNSELAILTRFTKVFEQTYTRFLDLKKAEGQAREAQIEAALERVRSQSMAMHKSEDIGKTVSTLFDELLKVGIHKSSRSGIGILDETKNMKLWSALSNSADEVDLLIGKLDMTINPLLKKIKNAWKKQDEQFYYELEGKELSDYYASLNQSVSYSLRTDLNKLPEKEFVHVFTFKLGIIYSFNSVPISEEANQVFKRFAKVFEQTYTRFLDLQKAEEQAREAQVETALEKVRSRTMAMHKSSELGETAFLLFQQMLGLGVKPERFVIGILDENEKEFDFWGTKQGGSQIDTKFKGGVNEQTCIAKWYKAWKSKKKSIVLELSGNELKEWIKYLQEEIKMPVNKKLLARTRVHSTGIFSRGVLIITTPEPIPDDHIVLLERFTAVFDQTYTRFLDLQKAEAQTREAQIEAALERVRAQTMAMHKSEDVGAATIILFEQLKELGIVSNRCGIAIPLNSKSMEFWAATTDKKGNSVRVIGEDKFNAHPALQKAYKVWKSKKRSQSYILKGGDLIKYYKAVKDSMPLPEWQSKMHLAKGGQEEFSTFTFSDGWIYIFTQERLPAESLEILSRFAQLFNLTYRRFLDLKKAETQTREAQIETSLERIRARTMGMHKSDEMKDVIKELFNELRLFDLKIDICAINIFNGWSKDLVIWTATPEQAYATELYIPAIKNPMFDRIYDSRSNKQTLLIDVITKKQKDDFYRHALKNSILKQMISSERLKRVMSAGSLNRSMAIFPNSSLMLANFQNRPYTDNENTIIVRFGSVFEQTYTRFLDLKKAEEQIREAQIEAALERVRTRSMAMHKTDELKQVIDVISEQFEILDIPQDVCLINIFGDEANKDWNFWIATYPDQVNVPYFRHPIFTQLASARKNHEAFYTQDLNRKAKDRFFDHFYNNAEGVKVVQKRRNFISKAPGWTFSVTLSKFASIHLANYRSKPYTDEENQILQRIGNAFEQTYTRFLELKKAEAREIEAIKQSSLDRVRAEIASMRTADDLNRITPLVWQELTTLGVPFFRCGVFIMDIKAELAHAYLSTPSGSSLTALELKFDAFPLVAGAFKYWQQQKVYIEEWDKKQFIKWTKPLVEQGQVDNRKKYQGGEDAPEHLVLQLVPFKQGMLYVGSAEKLANEQIELVKSVADAFSVAYARYEDFKQLEEAKERVEGTLTELKSTQDQLVQSEKMASLGELTAGIAHEIQNPLNFVNNFSEVSGELVEEINDEIKAGNMDEVEYITSDLKQNLEKINHHGKRASGIVKGMLEHSRTGSGEKELTDINKLADEYLRLSFHGLRAKDKSFNADFKTDFDESLPKVKVITQDLGRVILNLINNAFYACAERSLSAEQAGLAKEDSEYKPTVTVATRKIGDKIEISVKDNGAGIPEDIKEKIFQPFFTTKPTGSGTGLGLSMSYDIITKGHGGELKVESKEREGTEFIIIIPLT